jgi:hypothetical protein
MGANSLNLRPFSFPQSTTGQRVRLTADPQDAPRQESELWETILLCLCHDIIVRAKAKIYCELKKLGRCTALLDSTSIYNLTSAALPLFIPMKISLFAA